MGTPVRFIAEHGSCRSVAFAHMGELIFGLVVLAIVGAFGLIFWLGL
jgi:nitrate reductase NapE component